jgi:hypothetical protein
MYPKGDDRIQHKIIGNHHDINRNKIFLSKHRLSYKTRCWFSKSIHSLIPTLPLTRYTELVCIKATVKCYKTGNWRWKYELHVEKCRNGQNFMNMHARKDLTWGFFSLIEHLCVLTDSHELCLITFCGV